MFSENNANRVNVATGGKVLGQGVIGCILAMWANDSPKAKTLYITFGAKPIV